MSYITVSTYLSKPLMLLEPDWSRPPTVKILNATETLALTNTLRTDYFPEDDPVHVLQQAVTLYGSADVKAYEDFFDARFGRLQPFWAATWKRDLQPNYVTTINKLTSGDSTIDIKHINYGSKIFPNPGYGRHILFYNIVSRLYDIRKVTAAEVVDATKERLTLSSSLSRDYNFGTLIMCYVFFGRFAADDFEGNYSEAWDSTVQIEVMNNQFTFFELPQEYPT